MSSTKSPVLAGAFLILVGVPGCAAVAVEGARATASEVIIANNIGAARGGEAEAQYKVGAAHCCSLNEGSAIYNTQKSVDWLCKSAKQGYPRAMVKLGKILSGDVIDGPRVVARASFGVFGKESTNLPVAAAWLLQADDAGADDAKAIADALLEDAPEADQEEARRLHAMGLDAPCEWAEVIA